MELTQTENGETEGQCPRKSKVAVAVFIFGILSIFIFPLTYLATVILSIIAFVKIKRSKGQLKGKWFVVSGLVIPILILGLILAVWCQDAGPVPNEFTEADFVQVRPENEASWELLLQLDDESNDPNGAPAIGLSKQDIEQLNDLWENDPNTIEKRFQFIREHAPEIESLWKKSEKGRAIIQKLAEFDEISDLSEAYMDAEFPFSFDIKLLLKINILHSLCLLEYGDDIQACKELVAFDSVFRKCSYSAHSILLKLICYRVFGQNFRTASIMVSYSSISEEALLLLESYFIPFTQEQLSLKNGFINEYMLFKNMMADYFKSLRSPFYKHNSILRYYDGFCRNWIRMDQREVPYDYCPISVWPWEKPAYPAVSLDIDGIIEQFYDLYFFYNPVGSMQMKIMLPAMLNIVKIKEKIFIEEDLFQWVLARRMGQEGSLKARAYSDEYTVDLEKGLVFSVGPDGEPYTDDDIKLRIDPGVLGLN
jgi:hypothetical protein